MNILRLKVNDKFCSQAKSENSLLIGQAVSELVCGL